jgi:nucleoside-diphosphate-sugar epimerase
MQKKKETVALVGGTGAIGKTVTAELRNQSRPYRLIGRSRRSLKNMVADDPLGEIAIWDPENVESIRQAIRDVEAAIYMVGVPYTDFHLHPVLMRRFIDAAVAEKLDRILLIGTLYVFGRPQTFRITESHPRQPHTFKGRKRKEQEDILLEAHREGKIKTTVLRLPDFYGPGVEKSYLTDLFLAAKQNRKAKMIGPIDQPHEFVFVPDVGPVVVKLLDSPEAFGKAWNLGGAGVTTQLELAQLAFAGAPRYMEAGKFMLRILGLFNPLLRESVEMHYLLTEPLIVDDSALQQLLGDIHKTPYKEGVKLSVAAAQIS